MSTKHTPGPWTVMSRPGFYNHEEKPFDITAGTKTTIACVFPVENKKVEKSQIANAQLIAAAPEMLEALEYIYAQWISDEEYSDSSVSEAIKNLPMLIKKAKGE